MATSVQRGKGFGRAQWGLLERCCRCCRGLHWVCAASIPSSGFSCHRYDGALFADSHRAECGNGHHLSHRTPISSALSSQGRRLSRQGQTITQHYSLICNEPGIEKLNYEQWLLTPFYDSKKYRNKMGTQIQLDSFIVFTAVMNLSSKFHFLKMLLQIFFITSQVFSFFYYYYFISFFFISFLCLHSPVCQGQTRPVSRLCWSATSVVACLVWTGKKKQRWMWRLNVSE